jgi:hypothetical protein
MIRVPTIFDFDQGNRKQMQIEAAHYKRLAASRRPGLSRNSPRLSSCATRSLHTKVKTTTTILWSAFYCQ